MTPRPPQVFMREKGSRPVIWPARPMNIAGAAPDAVALHLDFAFEHNDIRSGRLTLLEEDGTGVGKALCAIAREPHDILRPSAR